MVFKGGRKSADTTENVLGTVQVDGSEIKVVGNSFDARGSTMHTIKLTGLGKDSHFGPQKFLAVLATCARAAKFFQEKDQIELTSEQAALLEQVEKIVS